MSTVSDYEASIKTTTTMRDAEGGVVEVKHFFDGDVMIVQDKRDRVFIAKADYAAFMKAMERPS